MNDNLHPATLREVARRMVSTAAQVPRGGMALRGMAQGFVALADVIEARTDAPETPAQAHARGRREALEEAAKWLEGQSASIVEHARKGGELKRGREMASMLDIAAAHFREASKPIEIDTVASAAKVPS